MYSEKIEQLISAALADGVLTEKEKQILFKRAQEQDIDLDEFEMVLDARLVELQKAEKAAAMKAAPHSGKLGDVRKCPSCGTLIGSFQMICSDCGYEFIGCGANIFVEKFMKSLDDSKKSAAEQTQQRNRGRKLLEQESVEANMLSAELQFIRTAPLPQTKEDCVEILNSILPRTELKGSDKTTREWRKFFRTVLSKLEVQAKISNNKELYKLIDQYKDSFYPTSRVDRFKAWWIELSDIAQAFLGLLAMMVGLGIIGVICLILGI